MKPFIVLSESLVETSLIPQDLWEHDRFEVRAFQSLEELIVLTQAGAVAAAVVEFPQDAIEQTLTKINTLSRPLSVLGVLPHAAFDSASFYKAGINQLLIKPFEPEHLQDAIEVLMGQRFRRCERKPINLPTHSKFSSSCLVGHSSCY